VLPGFVAAGILMGYGHSDAGMTGAASGNAAKSMAAYVTTD